jgi:hypothetical protein
MISACQGWKCRVEETWARKALGGTTAQKLLVSLADWQLPVETSRRLVLEDDAREAKAANLESVPALFLNGSRLADSFTYDAIVKALGLK